MASLTMLPIQLVASIDQISFPLVCTFSAWIATKSASRINIYEICLPFISESREVSVHHARRLKHNRESIQRDMWCHSLLHLKDHRKQKIAHIVTNLLLSTPTCGHKSQENKLSFEFSQLQSNKQQFLPSTKSCVGNCGVLLRVKILSLCFFDSLEVCASSVISDMFLRVHI